MICTCVVLVERERERERYTHTHTQFTRTHARNHHWWSLELFELWSLFLTSLSLNVTSLSPSLFADRELALHKILGDPERAVYLKTLRQRVSFQWSVIYIDISVMIHQWWVVLLMTHNSWLITHAHDSLLISHSHESWVMSHDNDSWGGVMTRLMTHLSNNSSIM